MAMSVESSPKMCKNMFRVDDQDDEEGTLGEFARAIIEGIDCFQFGEAKTFDGIVFGF